MKTEQFLPLCLFLFLSMEDAFNSEVYLSAGKKQSFQVLLIITDFQICEVCILYFHFRT